MSLKQKFNLKNLLRPTVWALLAALILAAIARVILYYGGWWV